MSTETQSAETFDCRITIVKPGLPDSVIIVRPAKMKSEKIWLNRQPGKERWKAIEQLMARYCPRGKYVPKPAFWHPTSGRQEDLAAPALTEATIPVAELDGAILEPLPPEPARYRSPKAEDAIKASGDKVAALEAQNQALLGQMAALTAIVTGMAGQKQVQQFPAIEASRKPGRPKKDKGE